MKPYTNTECGHIARFWIALVTNRRELAGFVPADTHTAKRSFVLALYVLPIFVVRNFLFTSQVDELAPILDSAGSTVLYLLQMLAAYATGWMLWPVIMSLMVPYLYPDKKKQAVPHYISAFCWLKGFEILVIGSLQLVAILTMTNNTPAPVLAFALVVTAVAFLYYSWVILYRVLDISGLAAFGFLLQYLVFNLFLQQMVLAM